MNADELQIVNNPGTLPDPRYLPGTDITVVFEGAYETYQICGMSSRIAKLAQNAVKDKGQTADGRPDFAVILHSLPPHVASNMSAVSKTVAELSAVAGTFFVTDLAEGYYAGWSKIWAQMVADAGQHMSEHA